MAQADTIIPPGVQGLDRYAYVNNSPLNFVDPSGHWPDLGTLNPFSYNTLTIGFKGILSSTVGLNIDISVAIDMKSYRESDFKNMEIAVLVNTPTVTVGPQAEVSAAVEVGGYDYSIEELKGLNPVAIEGSASVNASLCDGICVGAGTTLDATAPDGISSIRYSLGAGEGAELSFDVFGLSDTIVEQHGLGINAPVDTQTPIINKGFWKEIGREFSIIPKLINYLAE